MKDLISKYSKELAGTEAEWKDQQCIKYIPAWQRWVMDKFKFKFIRSLFNYGFKSYRSIGADIGEEAQVKTIVFCKGDKEISSVNFIYKLNPFNEKDQTSNLN